MSLVGGARLGPYEIVAPLGAGGMGEVYRAKDTRLGREVAIKVLPQHLSANADIRARFEREAKTISSLNHPHICTLFDVGRDGDTDFLVMELIEGETLSARLARGALPTADVLKFGAQIADALDRAHRAGVVHRDLKPGNVMLTRSGAKLMDFGLARATEMLGPVSSSGVTMAALSRTQPGASPLTAEGSLVGTFQYMAPEQLEGKDADARSDLWSLGCVLYEMATGRRAFEGASQASLIVAIMSTTPPPIEAVQPTSPPALDRAIRTCLAKDPEERYQSAHDVKLQLAWAAEGGSQSTVPAPALAHRPRRRRVVSLIALAGWIVALAAVVWAAMQSRRGGDHGAVFQADLQTPEKYLASPPIFGPVALAPDGSALAMAAQDDSLVRVLLVRDFATGTSRQLDGTDNAECPFWSADGKWIAFFSDGKLRKVPAAGGPVTTICEAHAMRGGSWSRDGVIVFAPDITGPLVRVSADGGTPTPVTHPSQASWTHRMPWFLPDGKRFLFVERESNSDAFGHIAVGSIDGGATRRVVDQASNPVYADGYLFYCRDGNLVAQRFDPRSATVSGTLQSLFSHIAYYNARDIGNFSVSRTGLLAFRPNAGVLARLAWYDRDGHEVAQLGDQMAIFSGTMSRDGTQAVLMRAAPDGNSADAWTVDLARRQFSRATFVNATASLGAVFSPDGKQLAVTNSTGAKSTLWIQPATGGRAEQPLLASSRFTVNDWSPDGTVLMGDSQLPGTGHNVYMLRLGVAGAKLEPLIASAFDETSPHLSPDGKWLVYASNQSGESEIYLTDFPAAHRTTQVSVGGGGNPGWGLDGREIYYNGKTAYMAVSMAAGDPPTLGKPVEIAGPFPSVLLGLDRSRALFARPDTKPVPPPTRIVRNWRGLLEN